MDAHVARLSGRELGQTERALAVAKVLNLVGLAFVFTGCGALLGLLAGPSSLPMAALGGLGTLVVLLWLRERTPLNLVLLYAFSTFEGMALGLVLEAFIREGLAGTVLYAAAATAAITFVGAVYGATTKRSLAGLGPTLFLGLAAVILASVIGLFVHLPLYSHVVAAISAVLFSAYIVYDVNRAAGASGASQGTVILLAVNVYLDILNLFLNLLQLLSSSDD